MPRRAKRIRGARSRGREETSPDFPSEPAMRLEADRRSERGRTSCSRARTGAARRKGSCAGRGPVFADRAQRASDERRRRREREGTHSAKEVRITDNRRKTKKAPAAPPPRSALTSSGSDSPRPPPPHQPNRVRISCTRARMSCDARYASTMSPMSSDESSSCARERGGRGPGLVRARGRRGAATERERERRTLAPVILPVLTSSCTLMRRTSLGSALGAPYSKTRSVGGDPTAYALWIPRSDLYSAAVVSSLRAYGLQVS